MWTLDFYSGSNSIKTVSERLRQRNGTVRMTAHDNGHDAQGDNWYSITVNVSGSVIALHSHPPPPPNKSLAGDGDGNPSIGSLRW